MSPSIEDFATSLEFNEGEKLVLSCLVSGHPKPAISWFKNHHEISFKAFDRKVLLGQNNSLIIFNLTDKDEAIYSCRASNSKGSAVKETSIKVNGNYLEFVSIKYA